MKSEKLREIEYCIFDPTGNITALVESAVPVDAQPMVAAEIMAAEPAVEQVGFVTCADEADASGEGVPVSLRMAGGEFCGNATLCAAALYMLRKGPLGSAEVRVKVSGAREPLAVRLEQTGEAAFTGAVNMPPAKAIEELKISNRTLLDESALRLPVVRMGGIDHIIIEPDSGFLGLKDDRELAESLIRGWCAALDSDCLGMMFLGESSGDFSDEAGQPAGTLNGPALSRRTLTPLVYVPGADTMFWENSCASGSAAAGIYLAAQAGTAVDVTFDEPAGRLRVESDPLAKKTVLHGSVILIS